MSKWFPDTYASGVVGRFIEIEVVDPIESTKQQKEVGKIVPALESKIPGSQDTAVQRLKDFNRKELLGRFPGAWDHFEKHREVREDVIPVIRMVKGTPIDAADFISRQKARELSDQGFVTVEHLAEMSEAVKQYLGRGALKIQRDAVAFLSRA